MKKYLIWLNAVLVLSTLTACESLQTASTSEEFTISGDQTGQDPVSGSSACDSSKKVNIQVFVSGGSAGTTFTVNAFCGGVFLGSSTATDPGNGTTGTNTTRKPQVQGIGTCTPMTTTSPTYSYLCQFNT